MSFKKKIQWQDKISILEHEFKVELVHGMLSEFKEFYWWLKCQQSEVRHGRWQPEWSANSKPCDASYMLLHVTVDRPAQTNSISSGSKYVPWEKNTWGSHRIKQNPLPTHPFPTSQRKPTQWSNGHCEVRLCATWLELEEVPSEWWVRWIRRSPGPRWSLSTAMVVAIEGVASSLNSYYLGCRNNSR